MKNQIHEKGYKNNPLTEAQKSSNTEKSRTQIRVQHVFGFMENSMGAMFFRKIGIARAFTAIRLTNLIYVQKNSANINNHGIGMSNIEI